MGSQTKRKEDAKAKKDGPKDKKADKEASTQFPGNIKLPKFVEKHVIKIQLLLAIAAAGVSVITTYNTPRDRTNFIAAYIDPKGWAAVLGDDYESLVARWGYTLPERSVERFSALHSDKSSNILEIGSGTGLVGAQLRRSGYTSLTGVDISPKLIELVPANIYRKIEEANVNAGLPNFSDGSFDALLCIGTTGYLGLEVGPKGTTAQATAELVGDVLKEWLRLVRVGGLIGFSVESLSADEWGGEAERLKSEGHWSKVEVTEPFPYMPEQEDAKIKNLQVRIHFYRKETAPVAEADDGSMR